ncbi:MAG: amidohydrolase family protein [Actinobacteria bacterium]|nr:amidohydrolase family protein [Actinomycetota bacterium]
MVDYVIRGATVVDGTGAPGRQADVAVDDGIVVGVGDVDERGRTELDAGGLVVTPGFVDPHTHYDAQLFWDPTASPSNLHGVTTVVGGNCGFTLAPIKGEDADYIRRMMAKVEGMPLAALEHGVDWNWNTFAEYLDRLDGNLAVNATFLVGHCALRRFVMGAESIGNEATPAQVDDMVRLLHESIDAGALGFSSSQSYTHSDGDGNPIASRFASTDEVLALCEATGEHAGTTLEYITDGCLDQFSDEEIARMAQMSARAHRPLNWNVLTVDAKVPERVPRQLSASDAAAAEGGRIVALTMPTLVPMNMSFLNYCALFMLPQWGPIMSLPVPERIAKLRDPETRRFMDEQARSPEAGVFRRLASWASYEIGDTFSDANNGLKGRRVRDIARERGQEPFDALLDVVIADDLRTILWPVPSDGDDESWKLRAEVWNDDRVLIGGSDAGAHLDRMLGSQYTTAFLADSLRGRKLVSLERAVQLITDAPARLFGLRGRGRIETGGVADLVVFDPDTIGATPARLVDDLPGGTGRLFSDPLGIVRVLVNGREAVVDGASTGALAGSLLRSGRDTDTVATS